MSEPYLEVLPYRFYVGSLVTCIKPTTPIGHDAPLLAQEEFVVVGFYEGDDYPALYITRKDGHGEMLVVLARSFVCSELPLWVEEEKEGDHIAPFHIADDYKGEMNLDGGYDNLIDAIDASLRMWSSAPHQIVNAYGNPVRI